MTNKEYRGKLLSSNKKLRAVAASVIGLCAEVDDYVHDTYIYFLKNEKKYIHHPNIEALLVLKIKGLILDNFKSKRYKDTVSTASVLDDLESEFEYESTNISNNNENEDEKLKRIDFEKGFKKIKQKCREILNLSISGENYNSIASILEIEIGTVKSRIARCIDNLRSVVINE